MTGSPKETPIRLALLAASALQSKVEDGIAALESSHRRYLEQGIRSEFEDSLDMDGALLEGHEQENR